MRQRLPLPSFVLPVRVDCRAERSLEPRALVFQPAFAQGKHVLWAVDEDGGVAVVDTSKTSRVVNKWTVLEVQFSTMSGRSATADSTWHGRPAARRVGDRDADKCVRVQSTIADRFGRADRYGTCLWESQ